ncbi:MAG TPA: DUF1295 domain-containing protein [Anaerolineales bacterium]|nr:DUF1295 domain-containing protein [Anaerolineales bacterium]HRQ91688.1 DUF1295 domain-containing protein [Anaerolineales bacterium]
MSLFWSTFLTIGICLLPLVTLWWLLSLRLQNSSIVDIFWGSGFVTAAWLYVALTPGEGLPARRVLLLALVTLWGLRLTLHIARRNSGKGEDFRYQQMRKQAGASWWWVSFFKVFVLQGALMWLISLPLLSAALGTRPLGWLDVLAAALWLLGFYFEAVGDLQLERFKASLANKGKVLDSGLWSLTRHPNYFGDAVQWWAFWLLAAAGGLAFSLSLLSPLVMTWLLRYVSGVDLLDRALAARKPGYATYMKRTPAFIPWPRKSKKIS